MTVTEFNQTVAREKLLAPAEAIVRIIERKDGEVKVEVLGKTTWVKERLRPRTAPQRTWTEFVSEDRPNYNMDRSDIELGPSAYMLLQWIRSLEHHKFSIQYAAKELNMSNKTIRKSLQIIRAAGKMPQERLQ